MAPGSSHVVILIPIFCLCLVNTYARTFDFYYFVQQWPGSYCDSHRKCCYPKSGTPSLDFSIHGLWPNMNDGTWPQFCDRHHRFNFSQVADLEMELEKHWASLQCPSSNGHKFWAHEWERHGTCSLNMDEHDYFNSTLSLRRQVDLLGALEAAGIFPDGRQYDSDEILEALGRAIGEFPEIRCNKNIEGEQQLLEVLVCVDKFDVSTVIPCPILPLNRCPPRVVFPPFGIGIRTNDQSHTGSLFSLQ
eukprot:Gb_01128 [translate_table: standard]